MYQIRKAGLVLMTALVASTGVAADQTKEFAATINVAGRQRMLSQKMMKELILIKLNISPEENRAALQATIEMFDSSLNDLIKGNAVKQILVPNSTKIESALKETQGMWVKYSADLSKSAKGDSVAITDVNEQSIQILNAMNKIVENYVDIARSLGIKSVGGQVVNIAGRQRMLTQRVSKALFLMALGGETSLAKHELKQAKSLFAQSHTALLNGNAFMEVPKTTDTEIVAKLKQVDVLWDSFSTIVEDCIKVDKISSQSLKEAAELNPKILSLMNDAVNMFERNAEEQLKQASVK